MKENNLGTIISKLRKEKGLTQKDLADSLNVSDKAVSRWERGSSSPNMDMIFRISKFFNISYNDLLAARVVDGEDGEEIVHEIIEEFTEMNKRKSKILKIIMASAVLVVLILTIAIIFTNTYNRFKVYNIYIENDDILPTMGIYVETKIKDTLQIGEIEIKNYEINTKDTISVDLYFIENDKEYIIQSYSSLDRIYFVTNQSYVEMDDLSDYIDNLYLKVTITDSKGKQKIYNSKLNFILDFSNNKIFYKEENNNLKTRSLDINIDKIKVILLENDFEETSGNILVKKEYKKIIQYLIDSNKILFNYEKDNFSYRYTYYLSSNILDVIIFNENNIEVENYKYDSINNKILGCKTGSCNNYEEAMELLNKNILNLLY